MKNLLLIIALCFSFALAATNVEPLESDTTIALDRKRIEIRESGDRMKIRVFEITDEDGITEDEMVFEGHYVDGKTYEKRKRSINIPLPTWNRSFDPHWAGFGMGFANIADGSFNFNDIDGVSLRSGKSLEYNLNFLEKSFMLSRKANLAIVIGAGMRWSRYRLDTKSYFKEVEGITILQPVPESIDFKNSRLNITSLTIPVLLEWQSGRKSGDNFFISGGVVAVIKTISSSRLTYKNESGKSRSDKMDGGLNIRPVTMDFLFQAGYNWIGMYAKYSPVRLFENNKGPKIHPVSIGLQLHL